MVVSQSGRRKSKYIWNLVVFRGMRTFTVNFEYVELLTDTLTSLTLHNFWFCFVKIRGIWIPLSRKQAVSTGRCDFLIPSSKAVLEPSNDLLN